MRIKLLILSIIVAAGFSFADDAVFFGSVLETDLILTPAGVTNAILATALTAESDPVAYPVATNALATATELIDQSVALSQALGDRLGAAESMGRMAGLAEDARAAIGGTHQSAEPGEEFAAHA